MVDKIEKIYGIEANRSVRVIHRDEPDEHLTDRHSQSTVVA